MAACRRCGGWGVIPAYSHVNGGVCRACGGTGKGGSQSRADRQRWIARAVEKRKVREALALFNAS